MRKQTKIAAVVSAAALLALGASMTSFAASKGTWMMVDGEWYCYDKNGDAYTNVFCSSNGKEYFVGDDGDVYYCGDEDDGHAKKNKWVKTWLPDNTNEEEDDKEWFWFDKEGKVFRAGVNTAAETAANAEKYKLDEGTLVPDDNKVATLIGKKKVNSKDYWFRNDGVMLSKFYKIDDAMYYFGGADDGSMKTGSQSIKDNTGDTYKFYFYTKDQDLIPPVYYRLSVFKKADKRAFLPFFSLSLFILVYPKCIKKCVTSCINIASYQLSFTNIQGNIQGKFQGNS